ncbi:MAG: hypothetical protein ACOZE5_00005, partial [Verrucomicrobiota bacterium]
IIVSTLIRLTKLGWEGSWPRMSPASTQRTALCSISVGLFQQPVSFHECIADERGGGIPELTGDKRHEEGMALGCSVRSR